MNYSFFHRNQFIARMPILPIFSGGREIPVIHAAQQSTSFALCCTHCGEVWGLIISEAPRAKWQFRHRSCDRCQEFPMSDAGSFLDHEACIHSPFRLSNPDISPELIKWEFNQLINQKELQDVRIAA